MAAPNYRDDLTAAEVRAALEYDRETGVFTWKHRPDMSPQWNGRWADKRAGSVRTQRASGGMRYETIAVNAKRYRAHRLAWLHVHGKWPEGELDHINRDGTDNRLCNLRPASRAENQANARPPRTNTIGLKGVRRHRRRFVAQIGYGGRMHYLGIFATAEEAHEAYMNAAREHHGEFARSH